jgi:hypothetical protein
VIEIASAEERLKNDINPITPALNVFIYYCMIIKMIKKYVMIGISKLPNLSERIQNKSLSRGWQNSLSPFSLSLQDVFSLYSIA